MNGFIADLKKANVRTLLPVTSVGFACMYAAFACIVFCEAPDGFPDEVMLLAKLAFFIGIFAAMFATYLKRNPLFNEGSGALLWTGAVCFSLPGVVMLLIRSGIAVHPVVCITVWTIAGFGYAWSYLSWPRFLMLSWQRDVNIFIGAGFSFGIVAFLFVRNLVFPYDGIAFIGLPFASALIMKYVESHVVRGRQIEEGSEELRRLMPQMGLSVALFGVIFGAALFQIASQRVGAAEEVISFSLFAGSVLYLLIALLLRRYVSFGRYQKGILIVCLACGFALAFGGSALVGPGYLCLLAAWVFLEVANYSALIAFSSSHKNPFWQIARGELVQFGGIIFIWLCCALAQQYCPWLLDYANYICLTVAVILALLIAFFPFPDTMYSDKDAYSEMAGDDAFEYRCDQVSRQFKLSNRESEIIRYLAKGRNAQFIADELVISVYTARTHIYHIYQKLGVGTQQELITIVETQELEVL